VKRDFRFAVKLVDDPDDGSVLATFPDVPEAITFGNDRDDAIRSAQEALAVALFGYLKEGRPLPTAKRRSGVLVAPHATDVLKIAVVEAWMESGMTKSEFARLLGVDEKEARRILDPDSATKADRLEAALSLLGRALAITIVDAA
jgi:antitoxin HicB